MVRKLPTRFTCATLVHSASSASVTRALEPTAALVMPMSSRPNCSTAVSTSASTSASTETSPRRVRTASPSSSSTETRAFSSTSPTTTTDPSATKRLVTASPIPDAPTVTRATFGACPAWPGDSDIGLGCFPPLVSLPDNRGDLLPAGDTLGDLHVERTHIAELEHFDPVRTGRIGIGLDLGNEEPATGGDGPPTQDHLALQYVVKAVGAVRVPGQRVARPEPRPDQAHPVLLALIEQRLDHMTRGHGPLHELLVGRGLHGRHRHHARLIERSGLIRSVEVDASFRTVSVRAHLAPLQEV